MSERIQTIALTYDDDTSTVHKVEVTEDLARLVDTASHLSHAAPAREKFDLTFSTLFFSFMTARDPCSQFFQQYAETAHLNRSALLARKGFDAQSFEAAAANVPGAVDTSPRLATRSARTLVQNAQQLMNETSVHRRLLDVRHLMGAYIYRPAGHGEEIEQLGVSRLEWSKAFRAFVRATDPDEAERWDAIEADTFKYASGTSSAAPARRSAQQPPAAAKDAPASPSFESLPEPTSTLSPPPPPVPPASTSSTPPPQLRTFDNDSVPDVVPLEMDRLGVRPEVERLGRLLAAQNVKPPIALGLFGRWGSGKSTFMGMLKTKIAGLGKADTSGTYVANTVQITFNAWHYQDTNLWANLALRIFEGIAQALAPATTSETEAARRKLHQKLQSSQRQKSDAEARQRAAVDKRAAAAIELAGVQQKRMKADSELSLRKFGRVWQSVAQNAALSADVTLLKKESEALGLAPVKDGIADLERLQTRLQEIQEHGRVLAAISQSFRDWRSTLLSCATLALLAVAVVAVRWLGVKLQLEQIWNAVLPAATATVPIVAWVARRGQQVTRALDSVTRLRTAVAAEWARTDPNAQELELTKELANLDAEIQKQSAEITSAEQQAAAAAAELQRIDAGGLVYDFLQERRESNQYLAHTGLISTIRQDLERLGKLLSDLSMSPDRKIGRIILYIDDLDRCNPDKVVEVLQAVHLLLAFDIFNVVVGVDGRWLERSLDAVYKRNTQQLEIAAPFTAQEYLEKIFQIPYALPPMTERGFADLVDDLLVTTSEHPAAEAPIDVREEVQTIAFEEFEETFIKKLGAFIETPRLAKRMTNLYRLLRARAASDDLEAFASSESTGTYRAALLLLAINMGSPDVGRKILYELAQKPGDASLDAFLERMLNRSTGAPLTQDERRAIQRIRSIVSGVETSSTLGLAPYVKWAPNVGAYSFDWYLGAPNEDAATV
jgi:KAP family P-loop domain